MAGRMNYATIIVRGVNGTPSRECKVDVSDYDWLSQWRWQQSRPNDGYARRSVRLGHHKDRRYSTIYMHRLITGVSDEFEVDHINGDHFDNRRENLRIVSRAENMQNRTVARNASGYRGVDLHVGRYAARATIGGRKVYLGRYDTADEAHEVVSAWRRAHMPFSSVDAA
jgi:hypothetical protein